MHFAPSACVYVTQGRSPFSPSSPPPFVCSIPPSPRSRALRLIPIMISRKDSIQIELVPRSQCSVSGIAGICWGNICVTRPTLSNVAILNVRLLNIRTFPRPAIESFPFLFRGGGIAYFHAGKKKRFAKLAHDCRGRKKRARDGGANERECANVRIRIALSKIKNDNGESR